jgi:hypothetical protein
MTIFPRSRRRPSSHRRAATDGELCVCHANILLYFEPHLFVLNAKLFIDLTKFWAKLAIDVRQIKFVPLIVDSHYRKRNSHPIVNVLYGCRSLLLSLHRARVDDGELESLGQKVFT